jgi:DEAD/DEAH box helicase domain-containing protein
MDSSILAKLDNASRIELYGLVIKASCKLDIGATAKTIADHVVLASVGLGPDQIAWATRDAGAMQANDSWSRVGKEIIVRGLWSGGGAPVQTIDQNKFFAKAERTALCSLTNELNGRVEDFGETFWRFVSQRSPLVGGRLEQNTPLVSIEYSDRYLNSPLPVRLLAEVIAHAPGMSSSSAVKLITTDQVSNFSSSSPTLLKHDWQVLKHRDNVLQGGLSGALGGRFTLLKKPKFDVPHGRVLRLKFADGGVTILLDQGFGYWWPTRAIRFDFSATVADQVRELGTCPFQLQSSQGYATWIGIKED